MSDKETYEAYCFRANKLKTHEVNMVTDARTVKGLAGFPWLVMAANPQMSNRQLRDYLDKCGVEGAQRTPSWFQRRRWMFRQVAPGNTTGAPRDLDGKQARAFRFMRENPQMSYRMLSFQLKKKGIKRSPTWVRMNRVKAVLNS